MNASQFSMENECFKEDKKLPRVVRTLEDLQIACNHEDKIEENKNSCIHSAATTARQNRANERQCEISMIEEAKKRLASTMTQ